jgi:hypothetical protein
MGRNCKKFPVYFFLVSLFSLCNGFESFAQQIRAQYSHKTATGLRTIALNEPFSITLIVENESIKSYSGFPDVKGFNKAGTSSQTSTTVINGKVSVSQSIIQNYLPTKEGTFSIPDFTLLINDKTLKVQGTSVTVGPAKQNNAYNPFGADLFEEFFGRRSGPVEYVEVEEEAFFALTTNKSEVYAGEGFHMDLSFFVAESNRAELQFFDLSAQLSNILKKLRPENCWEENFNISEIARMPVRIGNKQYWQFKMYEADYFPINTEPVRFPSVGLNMIKFKVARNPTFFGNNKQQDFKMFYTKPKVVKVKALPEHPLKDKVAVGVFKMEESLNTPKMETGGSVRFIMKITGIGNIASAPEPMQHSQDIFEVFPPNIRQSINRENGFVSGSKAFEYYIIPKEPGNQALSMTLYWVYFNTQKNRYDTLSPRSVLAVSGASQKDKIIRNSDLGPFYDRIYRVSNNVFSLEKPREYRWYLNIALGVAVFLVVGLVFLRLPR